VRYTAPIHFEDPNWTPDGKALIFNQEGTLQHLVLDDGIHPIDSTIPRATPRRVPPNGPAYFHGWSPDGKTISFTGQHGDNFDAYTIPVAGGPETLLASKSDVAEFSPDGQWIYFQSDRTGHMQ